MQTDAIRDSQAADSSLDGLPLGAVADDVQRNRHPGSGDLGDRLDQELIPLDRMQPTDRQNPKFSLIP